MTDIQSITTPVGTTIRDAERQLLDATLRFTSGNISRTARMLQIDRGTLYAKMRKHQIGFGRQYETAPRTRAG